MLFGLLQRNITERGSEDFNYWESVEQGDVLYQCIALSRTSLLSEDYRFFSIEKEWNNPYIRDAVVVCPSS